jgi:hypothetical protein
LYGFLSPSNKLNVFSLVKIRNSKWIYVGPETLRTLLENRVKTSRHRHQQTLLKKTLVVQEIGARIAKWDCIMLKSFCTAKEAINRMKRQPIKWLEIFARY